MILVKNYPLGVTADLGIGLYEDIDEIRKIEHQSNSMITGINQDQVFDVYEGRK